MRRIDPMMWSLREKKEIPMGRVADLFRKKKRRAVSIPGVKHTKQQMAGLTLRIRHDKIAFTTDKISKFRLQIISNLILHVKNLPRHSKVRSISFFKLSSVLSEYIQFSLSTQR
jgi:hypothetical protein